MKKIILLLVVLSIGVCMMACGKDNATNQGNDDIKTEDAVSKPANNTEVTKKEETEDEIDLIYTFEDPSKPIVFDYPNLKCIEEGTSRVLKNSKYVIVYCRDSGSSELKDIPVALSEKFYNSTDIHLTAPFDSFEIEATEEITINSQEVLKLNGYVVVKRGDGTTVNLPMQGYTFVKGDTICELIAVLSEESNDANQAEMEETIEAMINTLREDR